MELKIKDIVIVVLVFLLLSSYVQTCSSRKDYKSNITSILSENKSYIKDGLEHTESKLIEMSKKEFVSVSNLKNEVKRLQDLVKDNKRVLSATILSNKTKVNTVVKIDSIRSKDTLVVGDTVYIYPEYTYKFDEKWKFGQAIASKDSLTLNVMVVNDYEIIAQKEKWNIKKPFRKLNSIITVKNNNPNTYTTHFRSYTIDCGHNPWRDRLVGAGVGVVSGFVLSKF